MKCRLKPFAIGSIVKVKHCLQAYTLPNGLKEGDSVMVLDFDCGTVTVESGTTEVFEINMSCIDNGKEYEFYGKWYNENVPVIRQLLEPRALT